MIYGFGDFEFDEGRWELRRRGLPIDAPPKVMTLIGILLKNRDRVVSNEELFREVWPNVTVTEASVMKAVRTARQLLGDDGNAQRIIRTTRGRGYRLVTRVEERLTSSLPPAAQPDTASERPPSRVGEAPFVGREAEMSDLSAGVERALAGRASLFLVSGEAGIGKTRLLEAFAGWAGARGARVTWGRAWEEGGAPELWPWIQVLRELRDAGAAGADDSAKWEALLPAVGGGGGEISTLPVPTDQFRVFDAIARGLSRVAERTPLVVLLEDLHAADVASLRLLRFLSRELRDASLVVVGTHRPAGVEKTAATSLLAGSFLRGARILNLSGFGPAETSQVVEAALEGPADPLLVSRIQEITEGNPLFVGEIVRLTVTSGRSTSLPSLEGTDMPRGVLGVVQARLEQLPARTRYLVSMASVVGREFDLALLREIADLTLEDLTRALEPALDRKILALVAGSLGTYRFTHILLRDVPYDALDTTKRADLHRRVGEALEASSAPGSERPAAQLAYHFLRASLGTPCEKAAAHSLRASRQAMRALAFEEAAQHAERALGALRTDGTLYEQRCDALWAFGQAKRLQGDYTRAQEIFLSGAALARELSDAVRLAQAALGYAQVKPESGTANEAVIRLLREAAESLERGAGPNPEAEREALALVLARWSTCAAVGGNASEGEALSARALELAREIKRPSVLAQALLARHWALWRPGTAPARLEIAAEILGLDRTIGNDAPLMEARVAQVTDLLELGSPEAFGRALSEYERLARQSKDPLASWNVRVFRTTRAMLEGRFVEAEHEAEETFPVGLRIHEENARMFWGAQIWWIRLEQGRGQEMELVSRELVDGQPENRSLRGALLRLYTELESKDAVERQLELLLPEDGNALPEDWILLPTLAHAALAAALVGDRRRVALVEARLLPHDGTHVLIGPAILYLGPVSFYLGVCAEALGLADVAVQRFEKAMAESERLGAHPTAARIRCHLAGALAKRETPGDGGRARTLASEAALQAGTLGMNALERRARRMTEAR